MHRQSLDAGEQIQFTNVNEIDKDVRVGHNDTNNRTTQEKTFLLRQKNSELMQEGIILIGSDSSRFKRHGFDPLALGHYLHFTMCGGIPCVN